MTTSYISLFDLALEKIKNNKGYTLVEMKGDADPGVTILHFDTKEEFDKNFTTKKHRYYPSDMVIPVNVIKQYGDSVDCIISGDQFYLDLGSLYLAIDGKLQN